MKNGLKDSRVRGAIAAVRGSVVDVRFEQSLPPIYSVLHAGAEGEIARQFPDRTGVGQRH